MAGEPHPSNTHLASKLTDNNRPSPKPRQPNDDQPRPREKLATKWSKNSCPPSSSGSHKRKLLAEKWKHDYRCRLLQQDEVTGGSSDDDRRNRGDERRNRGDDRRRKLLATKLDEECELSLNLSLNEEEQELLTRSGERKLLAAKWESETLGRYSPVNTGHVTSLSLEPVQSPSTKQRNLFLERKLFPLERRLETTRNSTPVANELELVENLFFVD